MIYLKNIISENTDKTNIMEICSKHCDNFPEMVMDSNKNAHVTSFVTVDDSWNYNEIKYNKHIDVIMGNTKHTVLKYIEKYPIKTFDIIYIKDQKDYNDALQDIKNCFLIANKETIIIMESNVGCKWQIKAWTDNVTKKKISEIYPTYYENDIGISVGNFVF